MRQCDRVGNQYGQLAAKCRVLDRVSNGVAWMPHGWLFDLQGQSRSANALTPEMPTDWGDGSGFYDAFAKVSLLGDEPQNGSH